MREMGAGENEQTQRIGSKKVYSLNKSVLNKILVVAALMVIIMVASLLMPILRPNRYYDPQGPLIIVIIGLAACACLLFEYSRIPYAITLMDDNSLEFRSRLRRTRVPVNEIISIKALSQGWIKIKHRRGSIRINNQITGFHELICRIKNLNPEVEIEGC